LRRSKTAIRDATKKLGYAAGDAYFEAAWGSTTKGKRKRTPSSRVALDAMLVKHPDHDEIYHLCGRDDGFFFKHPLTQTFAKYQTLRSAVRAKQKYYAKAAKEEKSSPSMLIGVKWSADEDASLATSVATKALYVKNQIVNWDEIARNVPTRTPLQCRRRWPMLVTKKVGKSFASTETTLSPLLNPDDFLPTLDEFDPGFSLDDVRDAVCDNTAPASSPLSASSDAASSVATFVPSPNPTPVSKFTVRIVSRSCLDSVGSDHAAYQTRFRSLPYQGYRVNDPPVSFQFTPLPNRRVKTVPKPDKAASAPTPRADPTIEDFFLKTKRSHSALKWV
jgi:hypothetical protein